MLNVAIKDHLNKILLLGVFASFPLNALAADTAGDHHAGAKTWANNCARCHNMREPAEFRDDKWSSIMAHMRLRAGLSGQQARDVLAFLQSSNFAVTVKPDSAPKAAGVARASIDGKTIYNQTCVACHGANGKGVLPGMPGLAERLSESDEVLLTSITNGLRTPGSTSPVAMPERGGNPDLTDQDLKEVLSYIRKTYGE